MQHSHLVKFLKLIWKICSGVTGALGLASMAEGFIEWKNVIKKILIWYSNNVYPIIHSLLDFIHLDIPKSYYDYLAIGIVIGIAVLKYYLVTFFIYRSESNPNFTSSINEKEYLYFDIYDICGIYINKEEHL